MEVTVIGTGYVGTVTGACLAYLGHDVICVDVDARKIDSLRRGEMPVYEPHLDELVETARERGRIEFTTEIGRAVRSSDVIFIAVGTPSMPSGEANLEYLEAAARSIGQAMDGTRRRVVVNKSTVPVGSGNLVEALIREGMTGQGVTGEGMDEGGEAASVADGGAVHFAVVSNPEFLREGCAIGDTLYGDRIVVGSDDAEALETMTELYRPLLEQTFTAPEFLPRPAGLKSIPLVVTSLTSAEMIKYAANSFLALKISFANEIANISERVGADVRDIMHGIGLDQRIGERFLSAGIGGGGELLRQGHPIADAHGAGVWVPGEDPGGVVRAELRAEAARDPEAAGTAVHFERAHDRAAGAGVQTGYGRLAGCAEPGHCQASADDGSAGESVRPGGYGSVPAAERGAGDPLLQRRDGGAARRRCDGAGDGVAGVRPNRFRRGGEGDGADGVGGWKESVRPGSGPGGRIRLLLHRAATRRSSESAGRQRATARRRRRAGERG